MGTPYLRLSITGAPVPSGSRRVMPVRRRDGTQTYRLISESRVSDWIAQVRYAAQRAMGDKPPAQEPVCVQAEFRFVRPKLHYARTGELKADAPYYVTRRPDVDKLMRAVLDALTGVAYTDDCLVCALRGAKVYAPSPGVVIAVSRVTKQLYSSEWT